MSSRSYASYFSNSVLTIWVESCTRLCDDSLCASLLYRSAPSGRLGSAKNWASGKLCACFALLQVGEAGYKADMRPPSPGLIIHCHGGGFVAQSSSSHEPYLRDWARQLGVPILSVDYSLAPEAPFPRALEEMLYAYCWALKNCHLLGSTAQRVLLVGTSITIKTVFYTPKNCLWLSICIFPFWKHTFIFPKYSFPLISSHWVWNNTSWATWTHRIRTAPYKSSSWGFINYY